MRNSKIILKWVTIWNATENDDITLKANNLDLEHINVVNDQFYDHMLINAAELRYAKKKKNYTF